MTTRFVGFTFLTSPDGINPSADGLHYDGTLTKGANFFTQPLLTKAVGTLSIQFTCTATGTPLGSFAIQGSDDISLQESFEKSDTNVKNWSTLSFFDEGAGATVQTKAVSGAVSYIVTIPVVSSRWIRFAWTNTSGTVAPVITASGRAVS